VESLLHLLVVAVVQEGADKLQLMGAVDSNAHVAGDGLVPVGDQLACSLDEMVTVRVGGAAHLVSTRPHSTMVALCHFANELCNKFNEK
jgi:hypothetical protein